MSNSEIFSFWTALTTFFCGAVGGIAPSLIKLAAKAQAEDWPSGGYYLGMIIFSFLGGFVAWVYKERITHKAFLLGVGAPALIVAGGNVADATSAADVRTSWNLMEVLAPQAYAQGQESLRPKIVFEKGGNWRLVYVPMEQKGLKGKSLGSDAKLKARTPRGTVEIPLVALDDLPEDLRKELEIHGRGKYAAIPDDTTVVSLDGMIRSETGTRGIRDFQTDDVKIPPETTVLRFTFSEKKPFWSGFFDVLGMDTLADRQTQYPATVAPIAPFEK